MLLPKISKLSLLLIFDQLEAEKIEFKDTKGHSHFSHFQVILSQSEKGSFKINFNSIFFCTKLGHLWTKYHISQTVMKDVKLRF